MNACCSRCGCSSVPSPSSVVISTPVRVPTGVTQDRIARPRASTVQAPHWPSPQPNLGPRRLRSSLSMYSSGVAGSVSTVCARPLTVSVMVAILTSVALRDAPNPRLEGTGQGRHRGVCVLVKRIPMHKDPTRRSSDLDDLLILRELRVDELDAEGHPAGLEERARPALRDRDGRLRSVLVGRDLVAQATKLLDRLERDEHRGGRL